MTGGSGVACGGSGSDEDGTRNVGYGCWSSGLLWFQRRRWVLFMETQCAGQFGLEHLRGGGNGSAASSGSGSEAVTSSATAWRDSNPGWMGGRSEVGWSEGFGECRGLGVARSWIGGSLDGDRKDCASVDAAGGAMVSSASV